MRSSKFPIDEVIVARLDPGDDVLLSVKQVAKEHAVTAGVFSLIGAVDRAKVGFYNPKKRAYDTRTWEPRRSGSKLLEILACVGNVGQLDGDPVVHAHITLMGYPTSTLGGHLLEGCRINPTGELTLLKAQGTLTRHLDKTLNLALLSV
jgi:predicted DNA-binding protein with PD1-like motif